MPKWCSAGPQAWLGSPEKAEQELRQREEERRLAEQARIAAIEAENARLEEEERLAEEVRRGLHTSGESHISYLIASQPLLSGVDEIIGEDELGEKTVAPKQY